MPDLIRLVHGNSAGIKKLVREFRLYWKKKSGASVSLDESKLDDDVEALDKTSFDNSFNKSSKAEVADTGEKQTVEAKGAASCTTVKTDAGEKVTESAEEGGKDSFVSKRQVEMKIMAIAVREKLAGSKKTCWCVSDNVLQEYNLTGLSLENSWVYVSVETVKKTPNKGKALEILGEKSPDSKDEVPNLKTENDQDSTPKSGKCKKTCLKDQPTIMAFTKQTPGNPNRKIKNTSFDEKVISNVDAEKDGELKDITDINVSKNKKMELISLCQLPKDQPSIIAFAKKMPSKLRTDVTTEVNKTDLNNTNGLKPDCIVILD